MSDQPFESYEMGKEPPYEMRAAYGTYAPMIDILLPLDVPSEWVCFTFANHYMLTRARDAMSAYAQRKPILWRFQTRLQKRSDGTGDLYVRKVAR